MKGKEFGQKRSTWFPWVLVGILVTLLVMNGISGLDVQPPAVAAQTLPTIVYATPTAVPAVVAQAEANPVAVQDPMAIAGAESNSSTGQTGGESDSGALTNTDGNYAGDTIGGDQNITYNINSADANTAAVLAQTTGVEANATNGQPTTLQPCELINTVGTGPVLYEVRELQTMSQPINPAELTVETIEQLGSEATAARVAMQSCYLTEEAVEAKVCWSSYVYIKFRPETGLAGWFWVGPRFDGISVTDTIESCEG